MAALLRFLLWTALLLGVIGAFLHLTMLRVWRVPMNDPVLQASLTPTLQPGDLIVLWRLTEPTFGDLVLCPEPDYPERVVIGRVFGEGDDVIEFDKGSPKVNGKGFTYERQCSPPEFTVTHPDDESKEITQRCFWEAMANRVHMTGSTQTYGSPRSWEETTVPPGQLYLVSDNRLFPYDSRDYGPVPKESCRETVVFRLVSRHGWRDTDARLTVIQ
ncbi:MAG: signal peptidase I [Myxococcales bacterium]|jgi:signal peptidase I|nr:signal peptidase I [Myxococcales bacterium]